MSSQDVIKSTAKKLKYYMEVKRLEDAFDLSGPDKPQRHYPPLKPRPTLLYDGLHDRSLKHYFRSPEVKKHLAQMKPRTSHIEREDKVRRDVDKYMSMSHFTGSSSNIVRPKAHAPKKRRSNFKGGPFLLRSKHGPYLNKGEAQRLINAATKVLVASETVPLDSSAEPKKSSNPYRIHQNGDREMLPSINSASREQHRERPKSNYGIRPTRPASARPKSAMAQIKATEAHPSTKRYGYDSVGRRVRLHEQQTQRHYEALESEEDDDRSEVSDRSMNMLVPVASSTNSSEWLNIKMSRVSLHDDKPQDDEVEDRSSIYEESKAEQDDPDLYSIDNTTQTSKETEMQTVENVNSKDTQTRRANTVECLTDPYQADMSMQTDPPPISSSTQTVPPPPSVETQTVPAPPSVETQTTPLPPSVETQTQPLLPSVEVQTNAMPPSVEVQTSPRPPAVSTQTATEQPAMATQTMPEAGTQTVNVISTQTDSKPPEVGTQMTPKVSDGEESEVEDTYEHLQHGPKLKSGKRTVYEMALHTGNRLGASTKADIYITLFGEKGNTGKIKLKQSKEGEKMKFQKGQIDIFRVESFFVGQLECASIGHYRRELGCGWFCDKILIREFDKNVTYEFVCDHWLSAQDDDKRTKRTLPVTNVIMEVSSSSDSEDEDKPYTSTGDTGNLEAEHTEYGHASSRKSRQDTRIRGRRSTGSEDSSNSSSSSSSSGSSDSEGETPRGRGRRPVSANNNNIRGDPDIEHERENYMMGFKAGLKAREDEMRRRDHEESDEEQERQAQEERDLLSGPTIHECCHTGDLDRVKRHLQYSHDVIGTTNERGQTPLHTAALHGRLDIIKWLVVNNASINELTSTGYSCMHLSAMNGHVKVMGVLAALGVNVDCRTVDEQTPLHITAMGGHLDCCKWLVANGALLSPRDIAERTPLEIAEEYQHDDCTVFLKSCQRDLKPPSSPLHQLRDRSPSKEEVLSDKGEHSQSEEARASTDDVTIENEKQMLHKRQQSFQQQHKMMDETGMSFLDSIRNDFEQGENNGEQVQRKRQQLFQQLHKMMDETGLSFLDSKRNDFEQEENNGEQVQV